MFTGAVLFSGREWLLPAAGFLVVATALLWWSYRRLAIPPTIRIACISLKMIGLLALAACLLEPLWTTQRARPGANLFVVLADNSAGLNVRDAGAKVTRGEQLRELLTGNGQRWPARLSEQFEVRRHLFDSRVQSTADFSELQFDGRSTALGAALRALATRYAGQPVAGILLLTDGIATDFSQLPSDLPNLPPIYPVLLGRDGELRDVSIAKVNVAQSAFEDAPVTVQVEATGAGFAGENLLARLVPIALSMTSNVVSPTNHAAVITPALPIVTRASRSGEATAFRFQVKPAQAGPTFYRVQVAPEEELAALSSATNRGRSSEATLINNTRDLVVNRGRGPYRILYVAGRPNWEHKFLQRALAEDDQVELVSLLRIAKREPKFEFRGRAGESSNPLFRGFGNQSKEEVERYDQPVLVRLNTQDELELRGGFPKTPEDLFRYSAIIIDDLEAEFFTPDQMTLVQEFVSRRGGGLLMLGGPETFQTGKYQRTPIGDLLPVYLDAAGNGQPAGELRLKLTREGLLQPWARLRETESAELTRQSEVPAFLELNKTRSVKPGANIIATASDARGVIHPAIATQRFGNGRVGAVLLADVWRWGFHDENNHRDMDKAWRQFGRWLVADAPTRVELQVSDVPGDPNHAVRLQVRARDNKYLPLDNATVQLRVRSAAQTNLLQLTAEASSTESGLYEATFLPRETGGYLADAVVTEQGGREVGRAENGWTSDPVAAEFRTLRPNRALLETIAHRTGGEVLTAGDLDSFAQRLPNLKAPIMESLQTPLWHQPLVFTLALACFVAEWGLRRRRGLA